LDKQKDSNFNKISKKIVLNSLINMKPSKVKTIFITREKWLYISSIPVSTYLIYKYDSLPKVNLSKRVYLLTLFSYFVYKGVYITIKENYLEKRYKGIAEIFHGKVKVISVNTEKNKDIVYTLHSFLPLTVIESKRHELACFFINTNLISIDQDKKNKKILYLRTRKFIKNEVNKNMLVEDRLIRILDNYNFKPNFVGKAENEFLVILKVRCETDINKVLVKINDIASRMKLNKEELSIKVVRDQFHFEIKKDEQPIYLFHEYLRQDLKSKKQELPFMLGINQSTGQLVIEDIAELKNTFVAGIPGSGKSSLVNGLIQSSMFFGNDCLYVMGDLKGNELKPYRGFKNCIFINNHQQLFEVLSNLIIEVKERYEKLDTLKNLKDYNSLNKTKIPYILLFVDELAEITIGSSSELAESINRLILRIENLGRACGVFFIGSTQRISHTQVSTDNRGASNTTITFRVANKKDCNFTDSPGAEKLYVGEFIINSIKGYNLEKFKALWIDDRNQNYIFEELKEILAGRNKNVVSFNKNT
jgi:hypothetical protein